MPINSNAPKAIVLAHTKELVKQLYENVRLFANRKRRIICKKIKIILKINEKLKDFVKI